MRDTFMLLMDTYTQRTRNTCTSITQRGPNVYDVWTTLGSRCTDVACSLGIYIEKSFHFLSVRVVLLLVFLLRFPGCVVGGCGIELYQVLNIYLFPLFHHFNSFTTKKQGTNFLSANFQKMLSPSYMILRIQRLQGKQCGSK